ncbi:MAG: cobyrinic acid a,c-diamide synthase, partial [Halobacteriota archaeon]|nr:cobyrinic acid a,c-diamide synthase [Halobacteriota archaeon]
VYLSKNFQDDKMVGFLPVSIKMTKRHISFTINKTVRDTIIGEGGRTLKGHEFHYTTVEDVPRDLSYGYEVIRGEGIDGKHDGIVQNSTFASYNHLHFASDVTVVEGLVKSFRRYEKS